MSSNLFDGINPDLYGYYNGVDKAAQTQFRAKTVASDSDEANNTLSFQDMLLLMVTQLQNQTIDNQADTNDMMNQIIQMTVMQAITEMSTQVDELTEANILSYSASLVGQEVTVPIYDKDGVIVDELVGEVTATGMYNGQRVIFIGDECYPLNQIMAVGKLPNKKPAEGEDGDSTGGNDGVTPTPGAGEDGGTPPVTNPDAGTDVPPAVDENESGTDAAEETVEKALG